MSLISEGQDSVTVAHHHKALGGSVCLWSAWSATVGPQQLPCYHQPLDLTGPFIDLGDTGVAVMALCWHFCHVAHPSQDLDGLKRRQQVRKEAGPRNLSAGQSF